MVLTQQALASSGKFQTDSFHTTMVLTQHNEYELLSCGDQSFPYHYGSHATRQDREVQAGLDVSIPLWFSRNQSGSQDS